MTQKRRWAMGSRGREVMVTAVRSRHRFVGERMEPENQGGYPNPNRRDADQTESLGGQEGSGSGHEATCKPAIRVVGMGHGGQG
jgi:hypothetical protein